MHMNSTLLCGMTCHLVPAQTKSLLPPPPVCVPHNKSSAAVINEANPEGVDINSFHWSGVQISRRDTVEARKAPRILPAVIIF